MTTTYAGKGEHTGATFGRYQNPTVHKRLIGAMLKGYSNNDLTRIAAGLAAAPIDKHGRVWREQFRAVLRAMCYDEGVVRSIVYKGHVPTIDEVQAAKAAFEVLHA